MPKKYIPNPSDFTKPKQVRKTEKAIPEKVKPFEPEKKHRRSKRSFEIENGTRVDEKKQFVKKSNYKADAKPASETPPPSQMPLNKFVAHCGVCSRRDAVELIKAGKVKVNDKILLEPGYKVLTEDIILLEDKLIVPQQKLVYILLNKPKDFITTTEDPQGRKTVLDLIENADENRIYPVGRLDRNTTGLLLLTNDGDLAQKLSHPKNNIKKVYQVVLDKPLDNKDFDSIKKGVILEDGLAPIDDLAFINPKDKRELGIEIHIGRNRIVRRIFEHLGYEVKALDRVMYAGLTKKNIPRGKTRELLAKEVIFLKHFKSSKK